MRRIVPILAFVLVLVLATGADGSGSGVRGRVTAGPSCPVERAYAASACDPRGFKARIRIVRRSDRRVVARFVTRDDGRFSVRLRPGRYSVSAAPASGGFLPRCPAATKATVRSGAYTRVAIDCDSGIR